MNLNTCLAVLFFMAAPACAQTKEAPVKEKPTLSDVAKYDLPAGWEEEITVNQGDRQAVLTRDAHKIKVRLAGGAGSRYKTAAEFMGGFEALSKGGKKADKAGYAVVAGSRVMLFSRQVAVSMPAPDTGGPSTFSKEEFCVVPYGKQFFVLSYSYGDSIPDPTYNGLDAWHKFLKTFKTVKAVKTGK